MSVVGEGRASSVLRWGVKAKGERMMKRGGFVMDRLSNEATERLGLVLSFSNHDWDNPGCRSV